jgi:hypothetical protein
MLLHFAYAISWRTSSSVCACLIFDRRNGRIYCWKDALVSRAVERAGRILCRPILGGLHHQYVRI